jgi:predicted enzyme related to lactoylglutathione lyase
MMQFFMVELLVTDLEVASNWYRQVLQGEPILHDLKNQFILFDLDGGKLALKQSATPSRSRLVFQVSDLSKEEHRLSSLNLNWDEPPKRSHEGYLQAVLFDPDGNRLALFQLIGTE